VSKLIELILTCIGGATVGAIVGTLVYKVGKELKKIHRVAKHYHAVAEDPDRFFGDRNHFFQMDETTIKNQNRLYKVEVAASNARYGLSSHISDYKHTKTAAKVTLDKQRKEMERDTGR